MSASSRVAEVVRAAERRDVAARANALARPAILAGVGFFLSYVALHLAHAWQREPALLLGLSSIPLFRVVIASAACASVLGVLGFLGARDDWRLSTSRLLAASIVVFVVAITVWP
jgi:xanthine/uracil/vitamin C permease (AzgA family)